MNLDLIQSLTNNFESNFHTTDDGVEFWLARDLQHLLDYAKWDNFLNVILKAKTACDISGENITDHFADVGKMVTIGSNAEKELSQVISDQTGGNQNFALIRSKGDQALFGRTTQQMKQKWDIKSKPLADFMPTILLKAKDFATEITIFNAKEKQMKSELAISKEHITNNKSVRNTLLSRGIVPENLPPQEDINKVDRKLKRDDRKTIKNPDKLK